MGSFDRTTIEVILWLSGGVVALFLLALVFRRSDHARIKQAIADYGGRVRRIRWAPFGPGWLESQRLPIYRVDYLDHHGRERTAYCKTSELLGVYWTRAPNRDVQ